ncbi:MAG: hypothetical protein Q8R31_00320, partial [Candidatus Omnitrophota bacterium]|nr:hypothetical protein [Candidatus Omnitrophota bacterium]
LLVGISFAKSISLGLGVSLLGVNHLHSHIYANFLMVTGKYKTFSCHHLRKSLSRCLTLVPQRDPACNLNRLAGKVVAEGDFLDGDAPGFPFVALIVSGGHTTLFYVKDFDKIDVLGATSDDACGEAFDKVAKILGLAYPGGPLIERMARRGNPKNLKFSCSNTNEPLDFSFSGIKTAVLYYIKKQSTVKKNHRPSTIDHRLICDIAASFQEAAIDTLIKKSLLACKLKKAKRLVIGGGVAANNRLRERFYSEAGENGLNTYFPHPKLCMDNAAMVAGLGYQLFKKGHKSGLDLNIEN